MNKNRKVVVMGGGTGLSLLLRGLKHIDGIDICAIVTVADDGGSTGKLRKEFNIPAMGDLRRVISALSLERELLEEVMEYRFDKAKKSTSAHSLGNLIITALSDIEGSFTKGIEQVSRILNIKGKVIPVSNHNLKLVAKFADGKVVKGEHAIPSYNNKIEEIFYQGDVKANKDAVKAIKEADIILFSMGSLYTSIIANIAIPEIRDALKSNKKAEKIYMVNIVTQPGETTGMSLEDHVNAINKHVGVSDYIDTVIKTQAPKNKSLIKRYKDAGQVLVTREMGDDQKYKVIIKDMLEDGNTKAMRHDAHKITTAFNSILKFKK